MNVQGILLPNLGTPLCVPSFALSACRYIDQCCFVQAIDTEVTQPQLLTATPCFKGFEPSKVGSFAVCAIGNCSACYHTSSYSAAYRCPCSADTALSSISGAASAECHHPSAKPDACSRTFSSCRLRRYRRSVQQGVHWPCLPWPFTQPQQVQSHREHLPAQLLQFRRGSMQNCRIVEHT